MNILDEIKVTIANPYSYRRTKNGKSEFWSPLKNSRILPFDDTYVYTYYDENGNTVEESAKSVRVTSLTNAVKGLKTNALLKKRCDFLRSQKLVENISDEKLRKKNQDHVKLTGLFRMYWGEFNLIANDKGKLKFTDKGLIEHPGVLCFDVDKQTPESLKILMEIVQKDEHTLVGFVSPRGNGYKWLVRIPPIIEDHRNYYQALTEYYNDLWFGSFDLDPSCTNPSRTCFSSFDENIYVNEKASLWFKKKEVVKNETSIFNFNVKGNNIIYTNNSTEKMFKTAVERVEQGIRGGSGNFPKTEVEKLFWTEGTKHKYLITVAGVCKSFGMSYDEFSSYGDYMLVDDAAKNSAKKIFNKI